MFSNPTAKLQMPLSVGPAASRNSRSALSEYIVTTTELPRMPSSNASREGLASPNVRTVAPGTSALPGTVRVMVTIGGVEVGVVMRAKRTACRTCRGVPDREAIPVESRGWRRIAATPGRRSANPPTPKGLPRTGEDAPLQYL